MQYQPHFEGILGVNPSDPQEASEKSGASLFLNRMAYTVYILQSDKDDSYYIGYTSDINVRIAFHNEGLSQYTSAKRPWRVVYTEAFETKNEAIKREKFIKRQKSRTYIQQLISNR